MREKQGFTFLEIMLVIGLMAVLAAFCIPRMSGYYEHRRLAHEADYLGDVMRFGRVWAITTQQQVWLEFEPLSGRYRLTAEHDGSRDQRSLPEEYRRTFHINADVDMEGGNPRISFYPDGSMDKKRVHLCRGTDCWTVSTRDFVRQVRVWRQNEQERP